MTPHNLDIEEQDLLESYERGEWQSIPNLEEGLKKYSAYAAAAILKKRLVGVKLPQEDLEGIETGIR